MPHEGSAQEQLLQRMMSTDPWAGGMNPFALPKTLTGRLPQPMFAMAAHLGELELAYAKANPKGAPNRTPSASTLFRLGLGPDPHGPDAPSNRDRMTAATIEALQHKQAALEAMRSKTLGGRPLFGAFYQQAALELVRAGQGVPNDRTISPELRARLNRETGASESTAPAAGLPTSEISSYQGDALGPAIAKDQAEVGYGPPLTTNLPPYFKRKKRRGDEIFGASNAPRSKI